MNIKVHEEIDAMKLEYEQQKNIDNILDNGGSKDDLNKHIYIYINIDIIHGYKTIVNQILYVTKSINIIKIIFCSKHMFIININWIIIQIHN